MTITLEKYYKKKYRHEQEEFPDFHDVQLEKIFTALTDEEWWAFKKDRRKNKAKQLHFPWLQEMVTAEELIRKHSKIILNSIDRCTGERKYIISDLLKNIALRAKQLHMIVSQPAGSGLDATVDLCDKPYDELYPYRLAARDEEKDLKTV